jgi:toxin ParE1/3/4
VADVRLTDLARADLAQIRDYGVEWFGNAAAERYLAGLHRALLLLSDHPRAGQERPEFRQDVRSLPHRPHRILYTVADDGVLILRIIHQARDVRGVLDETQ